MTREEAIQEFQNVKDLVKQDGKDWFDERDLELIDMAMQVISKLNNPCDSLLTDESNGSKEHKSKLDLISRVDAIEALCRSSVYAWSIEQDQTAHNWALNIIKALPSAEAEEYDDYEHATLVDIKEPLKVEVVRCKECIYGEERIGKYRCHRLDEDWDIRFPSTHYCAWGERND